MLVKCCGREHMFFCCTHDVFLSYIYENASNILQEAQFVVFCSFFHLVINLAFWLKSPLYDWKAMEKDGYSWWIRRIRRAQNLFDEFRIDHFRGFAGFWAVPSGEMIFNVVKFS